jgi:quercetin dioxygenase-like cupin family protein
VIALPDPVRESLDGPVSRVVQWRPAESVHAKLLAATGRGLASGDVAKFVAKRQLAFAVGDAIRYPTTSEGAHELLGANTAIVQRLERTDAMLARAAVVLAEQVKRRVSVSLYVSEVKARAFSWHVDKWDNVVIQLRGRKTFELEQGTTELRPGDALFLPEDVKHRTRTLERSTHLSVVFLPLA